MLSINNNRTQRLSFTIKTYMFIQIGQQRNRIASQRPSFRSKPMGKISHKLYVTLTSSLLTLQAQCLTFRSARSASSLPERCDTNLNHCNLFNNKTERALYPSSKISKVSCLVSASAWWSPTLTEQVFRLNHPMQSIPETILTLHHTAVHLGRSTRHSDVRYPITLTSGSPKQLTR